MSLINREDLIAEYDRVHVGEPGGARKLMVDAPEVQPDLSETYSKAVFTWLLDYQIRAAELKGRYTPYEVLSWVANDWRKEHERK